jgi:exodeoxyribonuclease V alpha subunit
VVWLTGSYRFPAGSGIGRLAADINAGEPDRALDWIARGAAESVRWIDDPGADPGAAVWTASSADMRPTSRRCARTGMTRRRCSARSMGFECSARCANRHEGVRALNALLSRQVRAALDHPLDPGPRSQWYPGRPVMVLRNDYVLRVFNGDTGVCLPGADGSLAVWFADRDGAFRAIAPSRLPEHEDAFAITVHKAQGSEFDALLCVLPGAESQVLSRELLYTAVTRARGSVTLAGSADAFRAACLRRTRRHTGLLDRLNERPQAQG